MVSDKGLVVVLSGFSGAGKGTIMKHLLEAHPNDYNLSISATTRGMRAGEKDGREYFFKTREEFDKMIENNELLEDNHIDESRIAQEVTMYADKVCIDEEMVRLKSHVAETRSVFELDKEVGRKLDFLAQELNREANTILSKSTDVEIADIGITLKTLIEKVREQIQNIE